MSIRPLQLALTLVLAAASFGASAESVNPKDDSTVTLTDLINKLKGSGVTIDTPVYSAEDNNQAGIFSGYDFLFGSRVDEGVVFSTGDVVDVVGANGADNTTTAFNNTLNNDPLFGNVRDLVTLSFNVTPTENTLIVEYVFGSEEYNEYVNSGYNDFIRIFVDGNNCAVTANGLIVSIDAVNNASNNFLYKDNDFGDFNPRPYSTEMDGFTKTVSCRYPVTPGVSVPVVIGMADDGDAQYDSWAFFKAQSLRSEPSDEFGDAPDTYKTLSASLGAGHTIIEGVYMGTMPSGDQDGFADGFDDSLGNAADDSSDDGVLTFPNLDADTDTSYSITVNATSINGKGARIMGWIDFDRDGQFQTDEASNLATLATNTYETDVTLTWPVIGGAGPDIAMGTSFARIRLVNDDEIITSGDFAGILLSGEVEDYQFQITGIADITPPVVQIDALPTAVSSNVTAYPVTGVCTAGDNNVSVSVAGATPASQSVVCSGGGTWFANFDVSGLLDGLGVIIVNASQQDANTNLSNAIQATADKDVLAPSVDIQNEPPLANNGGPFTVTIQFSEDVTGFTVGDITVTRGVASNLVAIDADTYTVDITPTSGTGTLRIDVAANVAQDIFNNNNTAAPQATVTLTNAVDATRPVITLLGSTPVNIVMGTPYTDAGATALDNIDGDITGSIVVGGDVVDINTVGTYTITYNVVDAAGNNAVQVTRTVNVTPNGIFTIGAITDVNVNENVAYSSVTPVVTGFPIGAVSYTLSGADAGDFTIDSGTGVVSMVARNFEIPVDADTNNIYALTITATDTGSNTASQSWTVTVQDVIEIAVFSIDAISDTNVSENSLYTGVTPAITGSPIGTVVYSLGGADAGLFTINASTGVVNMVARDFESPADVGANNVYDLSITVTDADGNTDSEAWAVTVQDVVEVSAITIDVIADVNINENAAYTGVTPAITGTPIGAVTYSLGGTDAGLFTINGISGVVSMVARDFESPADAGANNVYNLSITITDADGNADGEAWAVTVLDVVEIASFTIDAITDANVNENAIYTGVTPAITGSPIGAVTYTLGGADAGLFNINASTGVVSMVARDFESPSDAGTNNIYDLSITVTDADGNSDSEAWVVTVQDVVEVSAITINAIADVNINENAAYTGVTPAITGTPIGAVTYSLGGTDAGLFTINGISGVVSMIARDFESPADAGANNVYDLSITVTDADGNTDGEAWAVTVQDVVEVSAISIDAIADVNINENAIYTGVTPAITGTPIGAVKYTLGGTDAGLFTINGSTGVVSMVARDFESPADAGANNVYDLSITVTDTDGNSDNEAWAVTVLDVVETASFTIDAISDANVNENAIYTGVTPNLSGAAPIGAVAYTLGGTDAGLFTINGSTGVVSMVARDFESPADAGTNNVYDLSITVTDADGNGDSEAWTVTVQDVVEVSVITIDVIADATVDENAIYTGVTPAITGLPIGSVTYALGGTDAALFTINSTTGVVSMVARDFESPADAGANNVYDLSITVTDADGNTDSELWSVIVQNVVEVASFTIDAIADATVNENTAYTSVTPTITGSPIGSVTYTLGGADAGLFSINGSTGVVSMVARDFESPSDAGSNNIYDLNITVIDADGNTDSEVWSVTVQNVVEVASFTIDAIADTSVNENALYTSVTPNLSGAAPIGSITYSLGGTDAGLFSINGSTGVVSMIARDFESPVDAGGNNIYDLTISVTDSDGNSDSEAWAVTVDNVVEAASFTIDAISNVNINENAPYTSVTPNLSGTAPIGSVTYTLGGTDAGLFTINSTSGVVSMIARDFESPADAGSNNIYDLSVTVTDTDGNSDSEAWAVTVDDVVEVSAIAINAIADANINENTAYTSVTPSITGTPIGAVTYTLGGTDASLFTINGTTGVVSMIARDFESPADAGVNNVYDLSITATDSDGNNDSEAWAVTVQDVVETASFTIDAIADVSVNENAIYTGVTPMITGSPIGAVTYSLGGTDAGLFTINGTTGVVSMIARDFESPADAGTNNVYDLNITVTDADGNTDSEAWSVTVQDVAETATITIDAIADVTVDENTVYTGVTPAITGTPIGSVTYILGGTDAGLFTINDTTGVVSMIARDFESPADAGTNNVYDLNITVTDADGNTDSEVWAVTVLDVVETASFTIDAIADANVNENAIYTGVTPNLSGAAPIGAVAYTLGGTDASLFTINGTTGVVSMVARDFELPADAGSDNVYDLSITATDSDGNTDSEAWSVTIQDAVETATITIDAIADTAVNENAIYTGIVPAITGTPIGAVTYTLGGTDAGLFTINASTGVVSMIARDFESPADAGANNVYDLSITVTDADGNNDSESWSVTVQDVVEADVTLPVITLSGAPSITIERGLGYFDVGATATDNIDGNITANIVTVNSVDPDTAGTYNVTYDVSDAAGNAAVQVTRTVIVTDTIAPGISIINHPASVNTLNAFNVTFQFTEVVGGFDITDVSVLNATASNFVNVGGVGDTYTADITPTGAGNISIGVNANVAQDPSANNNTAAVTVITTFDNTPPVLAITGMPDVNIANQSAVVISGTCEVGDGDVSVFLTIGALPMFTTTACVPGDTWSTSFDLSTVTDGTNHIDIGAQQTDGAGNIGSAPFVMISKDTVRPNVQIQNVPGYVNANEFIVTFAFDEAVTGFDSSDISVTNGVVNVASFNTVDAQTYTVGVSADGVGDVTLAVSSAVAQDLFGNTNNAATPVVAVYDITAPVVSITAPVTVNAANDDSYIVAGNCDTGDGDVTVSIVGATPSTQDVTCTAGSWTATFDVSAIADGSNALSIDASQTDAAGNTGNANAQADKDVLISVPTVNVLVTNSATPVISGTADDGTSNEVVIAGATYTVTATTGDVWSLDTAVVIPDSGTFSLLDGSNEVVVTSTDSAGNSDVDISSNEVTLTLDDDNDGIPNSVECPSGPPFDNSCRDTDGDGIPDYLEVDSDKDGIPDATEVGLDSTNPIDSDGDGIPDYRDTDSDNDGIDDVLEGVIDTDGDGIPDYVDVGTTDDSDGDGIPDTVECPVYPNCPDSDNDGSPDYLETDSDNDGIDDSVEAGVDPTAPVDTDGDGIPDYKDTDSDNEGTDDSIEGLNDIDGDGIPDYVDADTAGPGAGDSDGDGIADNIECEIYPLCADSDSDGTPDYMETDSDNDGILDVVEAGTVNNDIDNDGIDDTLDVDVTGGLDLNTDGIDDSLPLDTDGDDLPDYRDTDSDGDGLTDATEGVIDTDADGIPDYLDADDNNVANTVDGSGDSDGDGISDKDECLTGLPCPDVDRDGKPDYMDDNPLDGPLADFDGDGRLNYLDPDDDNDRIPDVVEDPNFDADNNPLTNPLDTDLDGIPDYLDLDSDNDGLSDELESGATGNDHDNDNIVDHFDADITGGVDANTDGIDDAALQLLLDGDSDNLPDYLDIVFDGDRDTVDTDKDGIPDSVECPVYPTDCPDSDADGTPDFLETDSDGDGIDDRDEAGTRAPGILLDTDGDGVPDYRDTDSDDDGIDDAVEGLSTDTDSDGIPDALDADSSGAAFGGDSDGDGVADMDECMNYPGCTDSDNDGTPDYMDADVNPYDPDAVINTGLNGVGSNGPWSLLLIVTAFVLRRKVFYKS